MLAGVTLLLDLITMRKKVTRKGSDSLEQSALSAMARLHSGLVMKRRARALSSHIASMLPKSSRVLDIGAGNGKLARAIMGLRPDVRIDGVDTMLWPERLIDVREFDGTKIPHGDGAYDACLLSDVLHHAKAPITLLCEAVRVARMGIVIKDHVAESRWDIAALRFMDWFGNRGHGVTLVYDYWDWQTWNNAFNQTGLKIDRMERKLGLYPFPVSLLFDRKLHFVAYLEIRGSRA
ncbi:MAG: class I SAM-dependent methyltransferase [Candidatus Hydrogenedentes bacterium]|nr:class I SAM-dependent methyltransferase [Candidatus Hydrogenedentota bacterium]